MFPAWLRNLVKLVNKGQSSRIRGKRAGRSRHWFRPQFEQFEDRVVPTRLFLSTGLVATPGSIVQVAVNVDSLKDTVNGNLGLSGADADIFYDPTVFTVSSSSITLGTIATNGSTANGEGYSPTATNGWITGPNNLFVAGEIQLGVSTPSGIITDSASGSLVLINFQVKSTAALGVTHSELGGGHLRQRRHEYVR